MKRTMYGKAILFAGSLFVSMLLHAQEDLDYNSIANRYSNENAVITNNTEHLVIKVNKEGFSATSYVTEERLLISDLSLSQYNTQTVYHSYFNALDETTA